MRGFVRRKEGREEGSSKRWGGAPIARRTVASWVVVRVVTGEGGVEAVVGCGGLEMVLERTLETRVDSRCLSSEGVVDDMAAGGTPAWGR